MHGEAAPTETAKDGALYGAVELWEHIFGNERGLLAICHASEAPRAFQTAFFNYPDSAASAMRFSREKAQAGRDPDAMFGFVRTFSARRGASRRTLQPSAHCGETSTGARFQKVRSHPPQLSSPHPATFIATGV
jgi:hypothetical protein